MRLCNRVLLRFLTVTAVFAGLLAMSQPATAACTHTVKLYDSFGDGWNGCTLTVYVNGTAVLTNITLSSGSGPATYTFQANTNDVITTTFSAASYPSECYYYIYDVNDAQIAADGLGYTVPTGISAAMNVKGNCVALAYCKYTIRMRDSYGDGWNGGYLNIFINGTLTYQAQLTSGSGPVNYQFNVLDGQTLHVTFVCGSWCYECEYDVLDKYGNIIYQDGLNGNTPIANYTYLGKTACTEELALGAAQLGYATDFWSRRPAPAPHKVKATVIDNNTTNPKRFVGVYKVGSMPVDSTDGTKEVFFPTWASNRCEITFTQPISNFMPFTAYNVYVKVFHPEDRDVSNNGGVSSEVVTDNTIKGYETFDNFLAPYFARSSTMDMGWRVNNVDGGNTWVTGSVNGDMSLVHYGGATMNDWVFMPAAQLSMNSSYRLQAYFATDGAPKTIEFAYGKTATPAGMTVFATLVNPTNTTPMLLKDLSGGKDPYFNTVTPGLYYVGIHVTSSTPTARTWFPVIAMDDNPVPPPVVGYGFPGAPIAEYISDPNIPIKINATYKAPGKINKTFSVANTVNIYGQNGDFLWDVTTATPWISVQTATPDPTLQGWNFVPERPRQFQTFTLSVDPAGLAPGVHTGYITFYAMLFADEFPPPSNGLVAINEPFTVPVELRISTAGSGKTGQTSICATQPTTMYSGNTYKFVDPQSGDPIATVQVTAGQIDNMTICAYPNQLPINIARMRYVKRYFTIDAMGTAWKGDITFPYANSEAALVTDPMQLRGIRQTQSFGAWEDPIMGTVSASDPLNNQVKVMGFNQNNYMGNIALAHPYFVDTKQPAYPGEFTYALQQNYPNPFNPATNITFSVPEEVPVRLAVFNNLGEEVAELVNDNLAAGQYTVRFDASDLSSGVYYYRLTAGTFTQTQLMTLSR